MHVLLIATAGGTVPVALVSALGSHSMTPVVMASVQAAIDHAADLSPTVIVVFGDGLDNAIETACARLSAAFGLRAPPMLLAADVEGIPILSKASGIDAILPATSPPGIFVRRIVALSALGRRKAPPNTAPNIVPDAAESWTENGSQQVHRALYASRSLVGGGSAGNRAVLLDIVESSKRRNAAVGISGALVHGGGYFVQILEGPVSAIDALLKRIRRDTRHFDMRVRERVEGDLRLFGSLAMVGVYIDLSDPLLGHEPFSPFESAPAELTAFLQVAISTRPAEPGANGE